MCMDYPLLIYNHKSLNKNAKNRQSDLSVVQKKIVSLVTTLRRLYVSQNYKKHPKITILNYPKNHPQIQDTTIPFTIKTNSAIPDLFIYFLSTLTISTSHTSNVLLIRLFDKFVILTKQCCGDFFSTFSSSFTRPFCTPFFKIVSYF